MPWKQTHPERVVRPCCGAWLSTTAMWLGHAHLPHRADCVYERRAS